MAGRDHPKRFYRIALIDPVDQPFATFRYFYRTQGQLRDLGVLGPIPNSVGEEDDLPVIEPHDESTNRLVAGRDRYPSVDNKLHNGSKNSKRDSTVSKKSITVNNRQRSTVTFRLIRRTPARARRPYFVRGSKLQPRAHIPHSAPKAKVQLSGGRFTELFDEKEWEEDTCLSGPPKSYRLSIPPSIKLDPRGPTVRPLLSPLRPLHRPPRRESPLSPTAYSPHPVNPMNNWIAYTPSPVEAAREELGTPSPGKRAGRFRTGFSLMGMISSIWKHRGLRTPDRAASTEGSVAAYRLQR